MDYILLTIISVAVSFGALVLWRMDRRAMAEQNDKAGELILANEEEPERSAPMEQPMTEPALLEAGVESKRLHPLMIAAMFVLNIVVALFMRGYYGTSVLGIVNMLLICGILWPCAWIDKAEFRIPNRILVVGLLARCVILAVICFLYPQEILYVLLQSAVAAVALLLVSLLCRAIAASAVGFGDVKLMMLMGFCLGTDRVLSAMICSMIVLFFYSVIMLITRRANRKTEIPFAPFLLLGTLASAILTSF